MLIGPLVHIFGSYTLLIVQWVAILIGGIGVFRYFQFRSEDKWLPVIAMAQFLAIWGNSSALSFDFHASVLGAMVVPWLLLYFHRRDRFRLVGFSVVARRMWGKGSILGNFHLPWPHAA
jgi:uncharacterized membrane protein